uniref:LITAF domain-containing protein n=1 Tax=Meloidogyne incognita TaxID=6306 RepID=A0A914LGR1_MELIC
MSVSSSDYEEMVLLPPSYQETPPSYVETSETVETSFLEQNNISNTQENIHLMTYLPQVRTSLSSSNNDELLSSPPSYHEAPPIETAETPLLDQNVSNTNDTQVNINQQSNIPQGWCKYHKIRDSRDTRRAPDLYRHCQTCKQRIITRVMVLKCMCILCILTWIFLILVRFEDKRGRQCESVILKLLNSTKCIERNITENNKSLPSL